MISIYTDASVSQNVATTSCFILTDQNFIGFNTVVHEGVETGIHGEILGAIDAMQYADDSLDLSSDNVTLYSDNIAVLRLVNNNVEKSQYKQIAKYRTELTRLKQLVQKHKVDLKLIKGHQTTCNPNVLVDVGSNFRLRTILRRSKDAK